MADPAEILTRPAPPPDLELRYGQLSDQVAGVWRPPVPGPHPVVVVVHGGFWRARYDRAHTGPMCAALAAEGYVAASIEYRRTGNGGGWPATFDDVAAAVDTVPGLLAGQAPGAADAGRVVLLGHSAGGQLALWAASRHRLARPNRWARDAVPPGLRGVVALAPVADLVRAAELRLSDGAVHDFLGGDPATVPDRYATADPVRLAPAGVPTVLVHGTDDESVPLELSERYAAAAGEHASLVALPGTGHFELIDPLSAAWTTVVERVAAVA